MPQPPTDREGSVHDPLRTSGILLGGALDQGLKSQGRGALGLRSQSVSSLNFASISFFVEL